MQSLMNSKNSVWLNSPTVRTNVGKVFLLDKWADIPPHDMTGRFHFPANKLMYSHTRLHPPPIKASTPRFCCAQKFITKGSAVFGEQFVFPNTNWSRWFGRIDGSLLISSTAMGIAAAVVRPTSHSPVMGASAAMVIFCFGCPQTLYFLAGRRYK